ncbi:MAG: ABC transporter ATP-binding protein [Ruminiclostridium sp.]|nr:ABC transporter ATP-binding protein [Ruminiclostridium sp.]
MANLTTNLMKLEGVNMNFKQGRGFYHALHEINLEVKQNDFICLLGSSGCGKTSLLNIMAGYVKPTEGEVTFEGKPFTAATPDVGVVFQQANLFPWMSVYKNVEFGLKQKKVPKNERHELVMHYLEMVGLGDAADKLPHQLSGGMRQRATIARTLAPDPKFVLFDEPFSALDALTSEKMQEHVRSIWEKSHKSFLFITHDVDEALLLGQRLVVMQAKPGRIISDYVNPLSSYKGLHAGQLDQAKEYADIRAELISKIQSEEDVQLTNLSKSIEFNKELAAAV